MAFDEEYLTKILQDFGPGLVEGPEPWRRQRMFDTVLALTPTPVDTSVIYQHPPCEYEVAESQLKQGLPWDRPDADPVGDLERFMQGDGWSRPWRSGSE